MVGLINGDFVGTFVSVGCSDEIVGVIDGDALGLFVGDIVVYFDGDNVGF